MRRKKTGTLAAGMAVLVLLVLLLAQSGLRGSVGIVLPENPADSGSAGENSGVGGLNVVEITPDTVGPAIHTLSRPASYRRQQTVETFWSGGSGVSVSQVAVSGGRVRVDTTLPDGSVSHILVAGDAAATWYDEEEEWTVLRTEGFTADVAQRMLSYETVRDLPVGQIARADYRTLDGLDCIYVETVPDGAGYADRYWVSISSGLLYTAERLCRGELVYRFTAPEPEAGDPEESLFLLPDGTPLVPQALPES